MSKTKDDCDWDLLDNPEVLAVVEQAVGVCAKRTAMDADDIRQEAYLIVATRPNDYRSHVQTSNWAYLYQELYYDLLDKFKAEVGKRSRTISRDAILEGYDE